MRPARIREVRGRLTRAPVMVRAGLCAELDLMHGAEIYGTVGGIDAELQCRRSGVWWLPSAR
jgi:hypothetical protein